MKYKSFICLTLLCILLTSCIPSRQIESLGIINARGVDRQDSNQIETTLEIFQFASQAMDFTRIISGKGRTIKSAVDDANTASQFSLTPEKIQLELYGKETAKQGMLRYLDTLDRDSILPDSMYMAISDTTAKKMLTANTEKINMDMGQFLYGLIEESSSDHLFPRVNFQGFLSSFYDVGKDPYLPYFEFENDVPKLTGIAIMQDDSYVGKLPILDKVYFNLIQSKIKDIDMEIPLPTKPFEKYIEREANISKREDTMHTAYNILKGSSKTKLVDKENLVFETNIDLRLNLVEMSEEVIINDKEVVKLLEEKINKAVKDKYDKILAQLQEWNADPLGYGSIYRIHQGKDKQLTREEWREKFPKITVNFNVDAKVVSHGAVD